MPMDIRKRAKGLKDAKNDVGNLCESIIDMFSTKVESAEIARKKLLLKKWEGFIKLYGTQRQIDEWNSVKEGYLRQNPMRKLEEKELDNFICDWFEFFMKDIEKDMKNQKKSEGVINNSIESQEDEHYHYEVYKSQRVIIPRPDLAQEFMKMAKKFSGNYEYIFMICDEAAEERAINVVLKNWEVIITIANDSEVAAQWRNIVNRYLGRDWIDPKLLLPKEKGIEIAKEWTKKLREWGVSEKDKEKEIVIDDDTILYYELTDMYEVGQKASVDKKCWILKSSGELLEKGVATPIGE